MSFPFDADILSFLWTTGAVLFGSKPRLRKNTRPIPVHYQRELLDDFSLTEAQKKYLAPADAQLAALHYFPLCTYRVSNYSPNLVRYYLNPADAASCSMTIVEVHANVSGVKAVKNSHVISFTTRFSSGKWLTTRNMELKSIMDTPDDRILQECRQITSVAALKKKHDDRSASLGCALAPPRDISAVLEETQKEHERFSAFQVERGICRLNPQGDAYLITDKAFNRGIFNHFNPFAKRQSVANILFSALVGAVVPLFGILHFAPAAAERLGPHSASGMNAAVLAIACAYALTGILLGLLTETQNFTWVFLITYIPAHWIADSSLGWLPYSTLAYMVSFFVCQAKRKRQLVLQS